jgi:Leucine-rich repeat (LRR) protein
VPDSIGQLKSLKELYLRNNQLSSDEWKKVKRLLPNIFN